MSLPPKSSWCTILNRTGFTNNSHVSFLPRLAFFPPHVGCSDSINPSDYKNAYNLCIVCAMRARISLCWYWLVLLCGIIDDSYVAVLPTLVIYSHQHPQFRHRCTNGPKQVSTSYVCFGYYSSDRLAVVVIWLAELNSCSFVFNSSNQCYRNRHVLERNVRAVFFFCFKPVTLQQTKYGTVW